MYNGDTRIFNGTVTNNGTAYNLIGMYVMFTVKRSKNDDDTNALIAKDVGPLSGSDAEAGKFTITLYPDDTQNIAAGSYYYDFQLVDPSTSPDTVTTLGAGLFIIEKGTTTRTSPLT